MWTRAQNVRMTPTPDRRERSQVNDALTAAHLYYLQGQTMEVIAKELGTSRSTVSRLLSFAKSSGLVDIRIRSPFDGPKRLEGEIRDRFGIAAHLVPAPDSTAEVDRLERVAVAAARVIDQHVDSNMTIGVAWGSTVGAVSRHLIPKKTHNVVVVQLNGSGNTRTTGIQYASEILQRFGQAYEATVEQFPVPAFFDDPETKRALWRERSTKRILDIQSQMGLVVFSVGAANADVPSHVYAGGYLEHADLRALAADRVVGDVATVFYRADGSNVGIELNARASGPDFSQLRLVPRRICVVAGRAKVESLHGAIQAGLVTDLVIDEPTAREFLAAHRRA